MRVLFLKKEFDTLFRNWTKDGALRHTKGESLRWPKENTLSEQSKVKIKSIRSSLLGDQKVFLRRPTTTNNKKRRKTLWP